MIGLAAHENTSITESFWNDLAVLDQGVAEQQLLGLIEANTITPLAAATALAAAALAHAEDAPHKATRWLEFAQSVYEHDPQPAIEAQIAYAQARLCLQYGQLSEALDLLQRAQVLWQAMNDGVAAARTYLGLTQILTFQGNYTDAHSAISQAIVILEQACITIPSATLLLANALRNQANLYGYLHEHQHALAIYERAQQILSQYRMTVADPAAIEQIAYEEACIASNRAVDLMALARLQEAEKTLGYAINHFDRSGDQLRRSYAISNLASLYARTGQYQQALEAYEEALDALWGKGTHADRLSIEELQTSDVMLLDQALVFLALNLESAAMHALKLAERLFTEVQRPYELGQTLYAKGILQIQESRWDDAATTLAQAEQIFAKLQNIYWRNRSTMARISLLQQQRDIAPALALLAPLIQGDPTDFQGQWYGWDLGAATELYLQKLQLALDVNDTALARKASATISRLFQAHFGEDENSLVAEGKPDIALPNDKLLSVGMPHLRFAHLYAVGRIERTDGNMLAAKGYFQRATTLLELQRATLPLEEVRIAFLGDKAKIYADWLLTLIDPPTVDKSDLYAAFAIVERARSRVLLERLLSSLDETPSINIEHRVDDATMTEQADVSNRLGAVSYDADDYEILFQQTDIDPTVQRELMRRHLHWLYNQLLGNDGIARQSGEQIQIIRQLEDRLEQLERKSTVPASAVPVTAFEFQSALQSNEQALAYFIAGDEVLVFVVTSDELQLFRHLCTVQELNKAHRDLIFQMGRVGTGSLFLADLDRRARRLLLQALARLTQLLIEPLLPVLTKARINIIPYGPLHQLPFHAFRIDDQYLIERYECYYMPSASIAVHQKRNQRAPATARSWSGLAVTDDSIVETETEVRMAATFFEQPQLYTGERASKSALQQAANEADILHISTHGLMRNDNPLFSSLKLVDGWIDVREIYQLKLRAQLVILSACRSGLSQITQGDELLGLVRGFLGAGAQTLIVSHWDLNDQYAPDFMFHFYSRLIQHGEDPISALRQAQCNAIANGHHPFWWAPFFVIGQA